MVDQTLGKMKFLKNWTIDESKLPKYTAFKGEFVLDLDHQILQLCHDSKEPEFTDDRKLLLKPILDCINKSSNTLVVKHSQAYDIGRFYAEKSISPICVSRHIKHTLFHFLDWIDLDMVKGHPSILCSVAKLNNYPTPTLNEYLANPDSIFKQLIDYYSIDEILTEDNVKDIFNISIYGGTHDTWIYQMDKIGKIVKKKAHPFVAKFIKEAQGLIDIVCLSNEQLVNKVKGSLASDDKIKKRVMSYWCQAIENDIIHICYKYLLKNSFIEKRKVALEYDGLCFKKPTVFNEDISDKILTSLNALIVKETKLNVKMKFKEYRAEHVSLKIIEMRKRQLSDLSEKEPETFEEMAKVFEENHAKIINKGMFIKQTTDKVIVMTKAQLVTAYENIPYLVSVSPTGKRVERIFIDDWLRNNKKQRAYDDLGCYPHDIKCPERIYNLWTPFAMENVFEYEDKPDDLKLFLNHILIICNYDKKVYNYFILWIAQMIRCPSRKSVMPVFISDEGSGKGTIIRLLERMLGKTKILETTDPARDVWGMFNGQMADSYLVILNEIGKKDCSESDGKIKGLITDSTITISNKGVGQYTIQSYHHFIATTNKPEPMNTNTSDRRKFFIKCSDELIKNKQYFDRMYKLLEDDNIIKTCYEYFKNLEAADEFHLLEMPRTEYAKDLCSLSKSPIEQFLGDYVLGIELRTGEFVKEILSSVLFEYFKQWKLENDVKYEINNVSFSLKMKHLNINGLERRVMAKGHRGYAFDVEAVKKHLGVGLLVEYRKTPEYIKELLRINKETKREEKIEKNKNIYAREIKKIDEYLNQEI
jgi:hypothetical protein